MKPPTPSSEIVARARAWKGTPVRWRGKTPGRGADCAFLAEVTREWTGLASEHDRYAQMPKNRRIERICDEYLRCAVCAGTRPIRFDDLEPGAIALFVGSNRDEPQHLAMIAAHPKSVDWRTVIHAYGSPRNGGRVGEHTLCGRESFTGGDLRSALGRLWKLYRVPGVAYG